MNIATGRRFARRLPRLLAWPLSAAYAAGARLKNAAYGFRLANPRNLSWPVISVGNLSVGGTGKTPVVMLLAELMEARGWTTDVLSRGYGRTSARVLRVDPQTALRECGDEPLMMARQGMRVYVGASRYQAGSLAERGARTEVNRANARHVHLLDDGFQHRKLARAVDIVLLQRADLDDNLLPAGRLREPVDAIERADICLLRAEDADLKNRVLGLMRRGDPARVWVVDRRTVLPDQNMSSKTVTALAFCAIGDPRGFFDGLRQAGVELRGEVSFRDHHAYTRADLDRLSEAAKNSGVQCFVTTEKDEIRLASELRAELETLLPLVVATLDVSLRDETESIEMLESLIAAKDARPLQSNRRNVR